MRKLGLGFVITGIIGQLSALVWTYSAPAVSCTTASSAPAPSQDQANSRQLPADSLASIEADSNKAPLDSLSSEQYGLLTPSASMGIEGLHPVKLPADIRDEFPAHIDRLSQIFSSKLAIIIGGLIAFLGFFLTIFSRKKTNARAIRHVKKQTDISPSPGLWVIELTLNTQSRQRSIHVIQQLALPVIRRENDFIVIGPYKQKQEASYVLADMSEKHGIRGWLTQGN